MTFAMIVQHAVEHHNPVLEAIEGALIGGSGWWIFSTAVSTMPKPLPMERFYTWFYSFVQLVAANHDKRKSVEDSKPLLEPSVPIRNRE